MKTVAESQMKRELNQLQTRLGQTDTELQNVTTTVYRQDKNLTTSEQVHVSTEKVETVDVIA